MYQFDTYRWQLVKCAVTSVLLTALKSPFSDIPVLQFIILQLLSQLKLQYIRFTVSGGTRLQFRNVSKFVSSLLNLSPLAPALPLPPSYIAVRMRTYYDRERERERRGERNEESMLQTNKLNKKGNFNPLLCILFYFKITFFLIYKMV